MIRDWKPCTLTNREVEVLRGLADALYDPHDTGKVAKSWKRTLTELEAWLSAPDTVSRVALRALLFSLELSPIRFGFGPRTMTSLNRCERALYVGELEADRDHALSVWKSLLGSAYFSAPSGLVELRVAGGAW